MSKFKVGDRVRVVGCSCGFSDCSNGKEGIYPYNEWNDEYLELVSEDSKPQPKFKVGDRVRVIRNDYYGNEIGTTYTVGERPFSYSERQNDKLCIYNSENNLYNTEDELELITNNEPSNSSRNKVSKIMGNIKSFVKNSLLSADEKLLRKYGFKDSCGEYTEDAKDFAIAKLCAEKEADMITVAQGLDAEASKK